MARVDVILPVRNGAKFLSESIESVQKQTFSDWRLIILDHGSEDESAGLASRYAEEDRRIELFDCANIESLAAVRNVGLAKCDCQYLMIQDGDDVSFPGRMREAIRGFEDHPSLLAVAGGAELMDEDGITIGSLTLPNSSLAVAAAGFFYNPLLHPAVTVKFRALQSLNAAYGVDILHAVPKSSSLKVCRLAEDYMLFSQLALIGECINLSIPLIKYRRHSSSVGVVSPLAQVKLALEVSRFLARSFCAMKSERDFDPGPFCNHADFVFDFEQRDHSSEFEHMAGVLRRGLGPSPEVERELAFRWILATRNSIEMLKRATSFRLRYGMNRSEQNTLRNWLLRGMRRGKYVHRVEGGAMV